MQKLLASCLPKRNGSFPWLTVSFTGTSLFYFFWIVLAAAKILGSVTEWTVRLPAALGGVGFVLAMYFFGRDFFNARVGAIAAIVLATSFRVMWESRWTHVDLVFVFFLLLALYFGARALLRCGGLKEILRE